MRLIARSTLRSYWIRHPATKSSLEPWEATVKEGTWGNMSDIKGAFPKASILNADRVRFEINHNEFRLIAAFDFGRQIAFVKFIGTHKEYDAIDALTVARF